MFIRRSSIEKKSNRVQFATWKEASRRDITGGVAGAWSPGGRRRGWRSGGAGRRGRCGTGPLRSLCILAVGYGSDGHRAPRGWTVNEIPSTPGRWRPQRHQRASREPGSWRARPGRGHGPRFEAVVAPGVAHRRRRRRRRHQTPRAARRSAWRVRAPAGRCPVVDDHRVYSE